MNMQTLTQERYQEMLRKVIFRGRLLKGASADVQRTQVESSGGSDEAKHVGNRADGAESWEATQFLDRLGNMQHELGPANLSTYLSTLNLLTSDIELRRFYARSKYGDFPEYPQQYRIPIRMCNKSVYPCNAIITIFEGRLIVVVSSKVRHFSLRSEDTDHYFIRTRTYKEFLEQNGSPKDIPKDFLVPGEIVSCVRPLDEGPVSFIIGLGALVDSFTECDTFFNLVWFLNQQKLGIVYDYTLPRPADPEWEEELDPDFDPEIDPKTLKYTLEEITFSMATLKGDYQLLDGRNPIKESQQQLECDVVFELEPFAFQGFHIEDACRYKGIIQSMEKETLMQILAETSSYRRNRACLPSSLLQ